MSSGLARCGLTCVAIEGVTYVISSCVFVMSVESLVRFLLRAPAQPAFAGR